jgi:hypothetical protein
MRNHLLLLLLLGVLALFYEGLAHTTATVVAWWLERQAQVPNLPAPSPRALACSADRGRKITSSGGRRLSVISLAATTWLTIFVTGPETPNERTP